MLYATNTQITYSYADHTDSKDVDRTVSMENLFCLKEIKVEKPQLCTSSTPLPESIT
jgi:hypothetical protein